MGRRNVRSFYPTNRQCVAGLINMLYFGYGSNMPKALVEQRVGSCERIGVAYITGYTLRFHKQSYIDHTGKCDAYYTGEATDRVWGAVYRFAEDQIAIMDSSKVRLLPCSSRSHNG